MPDPAPAKESATLCSLVALCELFEELSDAYRTRNRLNTDRPTCTVCSSLVAAHNAHTFLVQAIHELP